MSLIWSGSDSEYSLQILKKCLGRGNSGHLCALRRITKAHNWQEFKATSQKPQETLQCNRIAPSFESVVIDQREP